MCDACLIENIKSDMLSRRSLFTGAAATTAAVIASGLITAKPALAQAAGKVVDRRQPRHPLRACGHVRRQRLPAVEANDF
jgi:hypothetical protein